MLPIDIRTARHVCGVRSVSSPRWSGWVGALTFLSHDDLQIAFNDAEGMLRWQVPVGTLRKRIT